MIFCVTKRSSLQNTKSTWNLLNHVCGRKEWKKRRRTKWTRNFYTNSKSNQQHSNEKCRLDLLFTPALFFDVTFLPFSHPFPFPASSSHETHDNTIPVHDMAKSQWSKFLKLQSGFCSADKLSSPPFEEWIHFFAWKFNRISPSSHSWAEWTPTSFFPNFSPLHSHFGGSYTTQKRAEEEEKREEENPRSLFNISNINFIRRPHSYLAGALVFVSCCWLCTRW